MVEADATVCLTLSGAMSPVTVAGTLTQVLAEVLAGAAFLVIPSDDDIVAMGVRSM